MKETYKIVFKFIRYNEKSIMVVKDSKTIHKVFFIPRSLVINTRKYKVSRRLPENCSYESTRIEIELPRWYVYKELGFYR